MRFLLLYNTVFAALNPDLTLSGSGLLDYFVQEAVPGGFGTTAGLGPFMACQTVGVAN